MATHNPSAATAACAECPKSAWVEICFDADPLDPGAVWYERPHVLDWGRAPTQQTVTEFRHSNSNEAFTELCAASSKSWVYTVNVINCPSFPIDCYLEEGDEFAIRFYKVKIDPFPADPTTEEHEYVASATFDSQGVTLDNNTTNPHQRALRIVANSGYVHNNVTCPAGTPKNP